METLIPKVIHYCWFGKGPMTDLSKKCIKSWDKTGYEIKLWNEDNIEFNDYLKKCHDKRKYANMANFARISLLYSHGGIYLDTDVEIIGSFDSFLKDKMFLGWEDSDYINNAVWGSVMSHRFLKKCLEEFKFDGEEAANLSSPHFVTKLIGQEYSPLMNGENQSIADLSLYSREYFYPYSWKENFNPNCITSKTVSIHKWEKKW